MKLKKLLQVVYFCIVNSFEVFKSRLVLDYTVKDHYPFRGESCCKIHHLQYIISGGRTRYHDDEDNAEGNALLGEIKSVQSAK